MIPSVTLPKSAGKGEERRGEGGREFAKDDVHISAGAAILRILEQVAAMLRQAAQLVAELRHVRKDGRSGENGRKGIATRGAGDEDDEELERRLEHRARNECVRARRDEVGAEDDADDFSGEVTAYRLVDLRHKALFEELFVRVRRCIEFARDLFGDQAGNLLVGFNEAFAGPRDDARLRD